MIVTTLMKDKREITSILLQDDISWSTAVSCDEIHPYYDYKEGDLWFAIFKDGQIVTRVNGKFVVNVNYDPIKEIDYPD